MAGRGVHWLRMTRGRAIAVTVIWRTQMRTALEHLARNPDVGHASVVACVLATATGVHRDTAGLGGIGLMFRRVPIDGPFPHVADHVVDAVAVRRECSHRRRAFVTVMPEVL